MALDATLRQLIGYRLQRATGTAMLRYKAVFAEFGLRRTTFSCLSLIIDTPGLKQSQLGQTLAIERPNLVKIVQDLSQAGLVRREVSKSDNRAYALFPTNAGEALFREALAAVRELDRTIADGLSDDEILVLGKVLAKVEANAVSPKVKLSE
jgi:DNA-binding MarR family transcriptional regulator